MLDSSVRLVDECVQDLAEYRPASVTSTVPGADMFVRYPGQDPRKLTNAQCTLPEGIDLGILDACKCLSYEGIETFESCQGGEGHCFPEPTIRFHGGVAEGMRAYAVARGYGLPVSEIRRTWDNIDGELTGPHWEIVFRFGEREWGGGWLPSHVRVERAQ